MKRVLKPKANLKYLILGIIDLIIMYNMPLILKTDESIVSYRYNMAFFFLFFVINAIFIYKIENN